MLTARHWFFEDNASLRAKMSVDDEATAHILLWSDYSDLKLK